MTINSTKLQCPCCGSGLQRTEISSTDTELHCVNDKCRYAVIPYPSVDGKPVLIDFTKSLIDETALLKQHGRSPISREKRPLRAFLFRLLFGYNKIAERCCDEFLILLKSHANYTPKLLVVGGGTIGSGASKLYEDSGVELLGTDVYASTLVDVIADGHSLPFSDDSFDGVWIQAVLEHVVDPVLVVNEIHRVLRPNGYVYAGTPFMQQVHEGAYDFTRFTLSGHRWLFRNFVQVRAGVDGGAGTALIWSLRYFVRALTGSNALGTATSLCFFWLRFFDRLGKPRDRADAASGVFFIGQKSTKTMGPKDIVAYYSLQTKQSPGA